MHAVDCEALPIPTNGQVSLNATVLGSMANYSCDPGYSLVGTPTRVCQEDGTWFGSATCQGMNF